LAPGARGGGGQLRAVRECEYCRRGVPNLCNDLLFWNGAYAELARIPSRIVGRNLLPLPDGRLLQGGGA
jgi:threonine dehydrogenase-like Zn-dependent dehydrogenase